MTTSPEQMPTTIQPPSRLGAAVRRNPIALKELRGRMRGARAFIVLTVYVALMSIFTVVLYLIYTTSNTNPLNATGGVIGKLIFAGVVAVELFLVCFVAPAFTAGAISGERERQTFDLLRTTLLSSRRIVVGKLLSALAYIVLLLLVAVPLQSLAFLMGGITIEEVLLSVELLIVTAIGYGTMGIYFSAVTKKTLTASILTYTVALLMTVALPLLTLVLAIFAPLGGTNINAPVLEAILLYVFGIVASLNPIAAAFVSELVLQSNGTVFYFTEPLSNGAQMPLVSPWIMYTLFYAIITGVLIVATVRAVRRMEADD